MPFLASTHRRSLPPSRRAPRGPAAWGALVACALAAGCTFDSTGEYSLKLDGLSPRADTSPDLGRPDVAQDVHLLDVGAPEASADQQADTYVHPFCEERPNGFTCGYPSEGTAPYGREGRCVDGQFSPDRHCYPQAMCSHSQRRCVPSGCDRDCAKCLNHPTRFCTAFLSGPGVGQLCCVEAGANAAKTVKDPCTENHECKSGLCTERGNCFKWCGPSVGACPEGYSCELVTLTVSGSRIRQFPGCVPPPQDAGPPDAQSPDAGPTDAASADSVQPDAGDSDAGVDDAGVDDAGVDDAGVDDTGVDDAGVDDAGVDHAGLAGDASPPPDQTVSDSVTTADQLPSVD